MAAVSDLGGSGGAERLFSHLHEYLQDKRGPQTTLVTAASSLSQLRLAGRLPDGRGVKALSLGETPGRGKLSVAWMTLRLLAETVAGRYDLVHICLPSPIYAPFAATLRLMPRALRPRLALTVIDCTLASSLDTPPLDIYERQVLDAHRLFARWTRPDGVLSWYQAFVDAAGRTKSFPRQTLVRAAKYCFTEPARFTPGAKERLIVFAGRLSHQKRPLLFVDAVAQVCRQHPDLTAGWRFELYGKGVLDRELSERIDAHGLRQVLTCHHTADMAPVLARSRVFVSTQALENFTSLAMLEAMAAGNAVIAEDVGQTREFVRQGINGLVVAEASPQSFAEAIAEYLRHPERRDAMAAASRAIATDVHTIEHFADDITAFWRDVCSRPAV